MSRAAITNQGNPTAVAPADDAVLRALLRYYYLSSRQVCRLLYSSGSITYVQTKLKHLTDAGLLQRIWLPRPAPHGSAPSVYTLSRKGLNHLGSLGLDVERRYRPSEQREYSYLFLAHTLGVNDVLISAELLGRPDEPDPPAASTGDARALETPLYPLVVLPEPVRSFVEEGAEAMGVPPEFIAVHLVTLAGTVLGRNVEIVVKPGSWVERPILWTALVADAGSTKSPALTAAKRGTAALQREANRVYLRAYEQYEQELAKWSAVAPKQRGEKPAEPRMRHFFTTDATPEALAPMLLTSSGIAIIADELLGWTRGMDAYKSGKGKERQGHLELWSGDSLKIDRKGGLPILVERPVVGVLGGIQPEALVDLSGEIARADGFLPRFIWSFPVTETSYWNDSDISDSANNKIEHLFEQLSRLEGTFRFGREAKSAWVHWFDVNQDLKARETGLMKAIASKLPRQLARLALILHCLRYPTAQTFELDDDTVHAAIQLVEYHRAHARKTFAWLAGRGGGNGRGLRERVLHVLRVSSVSSVSSGPYLQGTTKNTSPSIWLSRTDLHKSLGNSVLVPFQVS